MNRFSFLFFGGVSLFSSLTCAADWVVLKIPKEPHFHAFDVSKLSISGEEVAFWRKVDFAQPQKSVYGLTRRAMFREKIHCGEHTLSTQGWVLLGDEGRVLAEQQPGTVQANRSTIVPDTVADALERELCKRVAAKTKADTVRPLTVQTRPSSTGSGGNQAKIRIPIAPPAAGSIQPYQPKVPPMVPAATSARPPIKTGPLLPKPTGGKDPLPQTQRIPDPVVLPEGTPLPTASATPSAENPTTAATVPPAPSPVPAASPVPVSPPAAPAAVASPSAAPLSPPPAPTGAVTSSPSVTTFTTTIP